MPRLRRSHHACEEILGLAALSNAAPWLCSESFAPKLYASRRAAELRSNLPSFVPSAGQICVRFAIRQKNLGLAGFEPAASCTRGRRSTKLSHSPKSHRIRMERGVAHLFRVFLSWWQGRISNTSQNVHYNGCLTLVRLTSRPWYLSSASWKSNPKKTND